MRDHGLAKEIENNYSSSSSSSSEESDEDMVDFSTWIAFSKSEIIDNSSYRHNAAVRLMPSQIAITSNHPVVEVKQNLTLYRPVVVVTKIEFKSGQPVVPVADQKPLKSLLKAARGKVVCDLCLDDSFELRRSLIKHKRDLHGESPKFFCFKASIIKLFADMNRQLVCPICTTRHKRQKDLKAHITLKH